MRRTSAAERDCVDMFSGTTKPQREYSANSNRSVRRLLMFCVLRFQDGLYETCVRMGMDGGVNY